MSIRALARELYRLQRRVADLEQRLDEVPVHDRNRTLEALRKARAERDFLRRALDGEIDR